MIDNLLEISQETSGYRGTLRFKSLGDAWATGSMPTPAWKDSTTLNSSVNHARSGVKQLLGLDGSTGSLSRRA